MSCHSYLRIKRSVQHAARVSLGSIMVALLGVIFLWIMLLSLCERS